ncbi:hypothetical protein DICVIV_10258 [Dictyocaulus viviparus]|uniref:Uncharacterized protein n=1 Tax=Dictyocaulus viviparus TaxID=29172 RepID=A0A0D8XJ10_DICVI|nr:hypothetical protein DICVIV_10258 [Dictyocaulus viviparus]
MHKIYSRISRFITGKGEQFRSFSAWIDAEVCESNASHITDAEKLFICPKVQKILKEVTGMDLEGKVFRERREKFQQRSHFALMTNERLSGTMEKMRKEAQYFLSLVPLKEPRSEKTCVLSEDREILAFDTAKFVFTDITFDATDQDRTVVVREVDGTLRTATPEEHDRMNRVYYEKPNRPIFPPPVFSDPHLQVYFRNVDTVVVYDFNGRTHSLEKNMSLFSIGPAGSMSRMTRPMSSRSTAWKTRISMALQLVKCVFNRVVKNNDFDVLYSTRHFGTLVFYLAFNQNIFPLLNYFGGQGRIHDCANLVRLQKTLIPDWRLSINSADTDLQIVMDFVKQNNQRCESFKDLSAFLNEGIVKSCISQEVEHRVNSRTKSKITIDAGNIGDSSGPLGELSEQYNVKVRGKLLSVL